MVFNIKDLEMTAPVSSTKIPESASPSVPCGYCGQTEKKVKRCMGCLSASFCNRACAKGGWPKHKHVCKLIGSLKAKVENWQGAGPICQDGSILGLYCQLTGVVKFKDHPEYWADFAKDREDDPSRNPVSPLVRQMADLNNLADFHGEGPAAALDLGCCEGSSSLFLLENGCSFVSAVDFSDGALDRLRVVGKEAIDNGTLTLHHSDALAYVSTCERSFDVVIANDLFPYICPDKIPALLMHLGKIMTQNGLLLGSFHIEHSDPDAARMLAEMGGWCVDDLPMVKSLLRMANFKYDHVALQSGGSSIIDFVATKLS